MDFDNIDDLSNEEVMDAYSDIIEKGDLLSFCCCRWYYYGISYGAMNYGTCSLQITSYSNCLSWCFANSPIRRVEPQFASYSDDCWCNSYKHEATWTRCRD